MTPSEISESLPRAETPGAATANAWYAALASQRLGEQPMPAKVLDRSLALFRDGQGRPQAVQDRCPHRGTELHLGAVTDGALACRYHGWRFAGDGRCVHIPSVVAGQEMAGRLGVRGFPCVEADGYVWVWMGEGPPQGIPDPFDDFGDFNWVQGALELECAALLAIENNLDWCHPVFAHPMTHGMYFLNQAVGFQEHLVEIRLTERGLSVFAPPTASPADAPDPVVALTFTPPDRVTAAFATGPQGAMRIVMHMVPTGEATCRQEWMVSTGPADTATGPRLRWTDDPHAIFEQDRQVLESVQRAISREGRGFERSVEADAPTLLARRVYALACAGRWPRDRAGLVQRRIIKVLT